MATLPEEFTPESVRFTNNDSVTFTESQSLILLERALPAQRWEFILRSTLMPPDNADVVWAYAAARKQDQDTTLVSLPRWSESGVAAKTTGTSYAVGDNQIFVSDTSNLKAGLYLSFAGHSKVYIVTEVDLTSFNIAPSLRAPVASGETITFDGVQWTMKIRNRPLEFNASSDTSFIRMELDLVEAL